MVMPAEDDGPFDDASFERDLLLAIEESKREAGLSDDKALTSEQRIEQ